MPEKPRGEMTPEERARARKRNKENVYLRSIGKGRIVSQREHEECRDRVREFNRRGMSVLDLSEQTGLSITFFSDRLNGRVKGTRRTAYDVVMAMEFVEIPRREGVRVSGAKVNPVGTRRRLHALTAIGYPGLFLGELMECTQQRVNVLMRSDGQYVYSYTASRVRDLYEKYQFVNPADMGVSERSIGRSIRTAARLGYAPPGAWDDDTIDDPDAHPEWTGHCGRLAGTLIHMREGQAMCDRCSYVASNPHGKNKIDPFKLYELYSEGTHTYRDIAELMGISRDLVCQYAQHLSKEERRVHSLSMVDKWAKIGYCDLCREQVQLYVSTGSKLVCANGVRKYRGGLPNYAH